MFFTLSSYWYGLGWTECNVLDTIDSACRALPTKHKSLHWYIIIHQRLYCRRLPRVFPHDFIQKVGIILKIDLSLSFRMNFNSAFWKKCPYLVSDRNGSGFSVNDHLNFLKPAKNCRWGPYIHFVVFRRNPNMAVVWCGRSRRTYCPAPHMYGVSRNLQDCYYNLQFTGFTFKCQNNPKIKDP